MHKFLNPQAAPVRTRKPSELNSLYDAWYATVSESCPHGDADAFNTLGTHLMKGWNTPDDRAKPGALIHLLLWSKYPSDKNEWGAFFSACGARIVNDLQPRNAQGEKIQPQKFNSPATMFQRLCKWAITDYLRELQRVDEHEPTTLYTDDENVPDRVDSILDGVVGSAEEFWDVMDAACDDAELRAFAREMHNQFVLGANRPNVAEIARKLGRSSKWGYQTYKRLKVVVRNYREKTGINPYDSAPTKRKPYLFAKESKQK